MAIDIALDSNGEEIVLYFDISTEGLHAQTFGNALLAFDEIYRAINAVINPGVEVEVEFIRSDQGSVRAVLKALKKDADNLIKQPLSLIVFPFLIGILTAWLTSEKINIVVNDNSYIVEHGSERIVLPRDAEKKAERVEKDTSVRRSVRNFFSIVEADPSVKSVDFRTPQAPTQAVIPVGRDQFPIIRELPELVLPELQKLRQQTYYRQNLVLLTAVLEKSKKRKWQFLWSGQKIWADINDEDFFTKLATHEYEFGQGDQLVVDMVADQELNEIVGAYATKSYHIIKVHSHAKGPKQFSML
jgi:hypothetical protein